MKKTVRLMALIAAMLCLPVASKAQNFQVLYDTSRECVTTTFEMFRPDDFGSTYCFVDMDFSPLASLAYTEIAREFCFWQDSKWNWLSVHAEFNGGFELVNTPYENAWLLGLTYSGHSDDFSKTWSFSAMYKAIPGVIGLNGQEQPHNFQLTGVWGVNFADGWCSFSGFADFWRQAFMWQGTEYIFMAVPQLWVNLNKVSGWEKINLSVGGEVEFSNNFMGKGLYVMPALGAKWTF